jgi:hypothetical protein
VVFCGYAIGQKTIAAILKNKMNLILVAVESDEKLLNECFNLVLRRMIEIEALKRRNFQSETQPEPAKKRGRKPKNPE